MADNNDSTTPLIRTIRTANLPDEQIIRIIGFFVKKGYIGSMKFGCYYLQYVPASKPLDHP